MKHTSRFFILLVCLLGALMAQSQVTVNAILGPPEKIRIGEQTRIDLYLNYNAKEQKSLNVAWPQLEDTLNRKEIEVVSVSRIDTTIPDKNRPEIMQQHMQITVTSFDSGYYAIAPFKFVVNNDTANPLLTEPLLLEVHTVPTDSTLAKIKDIKPPFDEPFDWKWYLPYLYWGLGILAAVVAIVLIVLRLSRKKPQEPVVVEAPKIAPHIPALQALEQIRQESVWKEGRIKEYYSSIADTVRLYIEGRFKINALELTSDEILQIFRSQVIDHESKEKLRQLLTLSDLAKFAKMVPIEAEHVMTLNNAFDFVNGTKREETMPNPGENKK